MLQVEEKYGWMPMGKLKPAPYGLNNGDDSRSETLIFNCCHS